MGLFDRLRGLVPGAAQLAARNAWMASANPPPAWLLAPSGDDAPDVSAPMPLPDRSDGQGATSPMPLPDGSDPSLDDIRAQLLAGMNSRIGPEHFALNPDNWTAPPVTRSLTWLPYGSALDQGTIQSIPAGAYGNAAPLGY
jgi:hypothetical protein